MPALSVVGMLAAFLAMRWFRVADRLALACATEVVRVAPGGWWCGKHVGTCGKHVGTSVLQCGNLGSHT